MAGGGLRTGAHEGEDEFCRVRPRGEDLLAPDDEVAPVAYRTRRESREIGSGIGFGQAHGEAQAARRHLGEVAALLLVRPEVLQAPCAEGHGRGIGVHEARCRPGHFLTDDAQGYLVGARAAVLFVDGEPAEAERRHLRVELGGELLRSIELRYLVVGRFLLEEGPQGLLQRNVLVGDSEVHVSPPLARRSCAGGDNGPWSIGPAAAPMPIR